MNASALGGQFYIVKSVDHDAFRQQLKDACLFLLWVSALEKTSSLIVNGSLRPRLVTDRQTDRRTIDEYVCYAVPVPVKTCIVTFTGPDETVHQVRTLGRERLRSGRYGLRQFRDDTWSAEASHWTGLLEVTVKQPEVKHRVFLEKFERFVKAEGGTLRQRSRRDRVKETLDEK